jgi:hypothetical protein
MAKKRKPVKPSTDGPVESWRGADEELFGLGFERQLIIAHAPVTAVAKAVDAVRRRHKWEWVTHLIQLRGQGWTVVDEMGYLLRGLASPDGSRELSEELGREVVAFVYQDTAGCDAVWIFNAGEEILRIDNVGGLGYRCEEFPEELGELDVRGHLNHYLLAREAYFPCVYYEEQRPVILGIKDEDIISFERVPGE